MDAWQNVHTRLANMHNLHMRILATLQTIDSIRLAHDGADEARILCKLKAISDICAQKQDFSEFAILCAAMSLPNEPKTCPLCQ